jgi:hypothetical protein
MIRAAERLDKLSAKVADPTVKVDTAAATVEILRINAMLDRLGGKKVDVTVGVDRSLFSRIGGALGGLGGAIGGAGGAIGGGVSSLGQYGQGALYGTLGGLAALLGPALLPLALGGLVGGGAAGGALALGSKAHQQLLTLRQSLLSANQSVASAQRSLAQATSGQSRASAQFTLNQATARQQLIQQRIGALQQSHGSALDVFGAFQGLGRTALGVFSGALEAKGPPVIGPSGRPIPGSGAPSFLTGLTGILQQLGGFIKSIGPQLAELFRASVPYLQLFVKFLEQSAKVLLPSFIQMLHEMEPLLPVLSKGFLDIVKGFAGFLNAIGPSGMKASARIFVILAEGMAAALVGIGHALNWLTENIPTWTRKIHNEFDVLRHETAVIFDGIRHDIASFFHGIATDFDTWRHGWAHIWDSVYNDTIGAVIRIDKGIIGWFDRIPGQVLDALRGLGHSLYAFAHSALSEFLNGLKSVWSSVWGWIKSTIGGIPHDIMSFLGMSPPHAGSAFYDLGASFMHHLEAGMKSRAQGIGIGAIRGALGGAAGAAGTGVQRWAPVALQALRMLGQPAGDLGVVLAQMQTESGGNPVIVNKWDSNWAAGTPSVGLMQVIGPTFDAYAGPFRNVGPFEYGTSVNPLANLYAGLNYAIHRYGPAWTRVLGQGHGYDQGGWLPPGVTLAVNRTGVPERVLPPGSATGNTYITVQVGHGTHPVAAAQEIAKILNQGAHLGGVKLRSSILGPG